MNNKRLKKNFCILALLFLSHTVQAFDLAGAVSGATGGTGVGVHEEVDGVYLNPALLPMFKNKVLAVSYSKEHVNAQISDNGRDAFFPAAVLYTSSDRGGLQTKTYHLVLAYAFTNQFSFGLDGGLRELRLTVPGSTDEKFRQTVLSAGLYFQPLNELSFGLVAKNRPLNNSDLADALDQTGSVAFGMSYVYQQFAKLRGDVESSYQDKTDKLIYKVGLETYVNDWIITRVGYQNDNFLGLNYFTAGLGFAGPQFGLHYAYQSEANKKTDPLHTIDLNIPF